MTPTPEQLTAAIQRLRQIAGTLRATPPTLLLGQSVTLHWHVEDAAGSDAAPVGVQLMTAPGRRQPVARDGALGDRPAATTTYDLQATAPPLTKTLASVTVPVTASHCTAYTLDLETMRTALSDALSASYGGAGVHLHGHRVWLRQPPRLALLRQGLRLDLAFTVELHDAPDPAIDVAADVALGARDGEPAAGFHRFSVEFAFPWWFDAAALGIAPRVAAWTNDRFTPELKAQLLAALVDPISRQAARYHAVQPHETLLGLRVAPEGMVLTFCPTG